MHFATRVKYMKLASISLLVTQLKNSQTLSSSYLPLLLHRFSSALHLKRIFQNWQSTVIMGSQSIPGSDNELANGFGNEKKSESFVVDVENFGYGLIDKESTTARIHNSKITLQRNLSRKGSSNRSERENTTHFASSSSPKASQLGSNTQENSDSAFTSSCMEGATMTGGTTEHQHSAANTLPQQHQITIKTGNINAGPASGEKRWGRRSNSFRRSPPSCFSDPRRILLLFATLSSIGTMLLIYFTLTISKPTGENNDLD